jgi:hypothetical protein
MVMRMKIPKLSELPPDWRAHLLEERRRAREAARMFVRVCAKGEAHLLYKAAHYLDEQYNDAWRFACAGIAKLPRVSAKIQETFVPIWVEHKMLPLTVGDRPLLAKALRVLLPGGYSGPPLTVYRGAGSGERRRRIYGFSWTTDAAVARRFAEHWAKPLPAFGTSRPDQGVVLQTSVPREAVLLIRKPGDYYIRKPGDYYDEGEVVVDPFRLGRIKVVERLTAGNIQPDHRSEEKD